MAAKLELGKLTQITDLQTVWPNEALDFTPWLSKEANLNALGEAIGIDMVLEEKESSVGDFSVDIFAKEDGTDRRIIIENQLRDSDHDHLGKIITYASGKDASVVVWIVKRARDEHRQAIEWLNQHTDDEVAFFLVEIELWKIGDSLTAPKFNVVERPNDWAKTIKKLDSMTPGDALKLDFWSRFNDYAHGRKEFTDVFNTRKPSTWNWYNITVGNSSVNVELTVDTKKRLVNAGLITYESPELYESLQADKDKLEELLGGKTTWRPAGKQSRFYVTLKDVDLKDNQSCITAFSWYIEKALILRKIAKEYTK